MNTNVFNYQTNDPSVSDLITVFKKNIFATLNCISIGYVDEYDNVNRISKVILYNKKVVGLRDNGEHILQDYPPIWAKTLFLGGVDTSIDWQVKQGDECIVFFCDREIETPWISGQVSDVKHNRNHNITDAICLVGFRTLPKMTATNENLNLYSKNGIINIKGNTVIDGNLTINGNLTVTGDATIGGISFLNHIHTDSQGGSTTPPQ